MVRSQSAALDRKKLMADPIMVTTIVVLITFLTLFILYPLAILLVDSFVGDGSFGFGIFERIFAMPTFTKAITNTLKVGFLVGILSALLGLLFAYVEVYVRVGKFVGGLFKVVSMLPVVSPPFGHHHPLPARHLRQQRLRLLGHRRRADAHLLPRVLHDAQGSFEEHRPLA